MLGCSFTPTQMQTGWLCLIFLLPQLYHEEGEDDKAGSSTSGRGEEWVRLTKLYQFARNVRGLLHTYHYNQIFLTDFHGAYNKFTGCSLEPRCYGYVSTDELLSAIPQVGINVIFAAVHLELEILMCLGLLSNTWFLSELVIDLAIYLVILSLHIFIVFWCVIIRWSGSKGTVARRLSFWRTIWKVKVS